MYSRRIQPQDQSIRSTTGPIWNRLRNRPPQGLSRSQTSETMETKNKPQGPIFFEVPRPPFGFGPVARLVVENDQNAFEARHDTIQSRKRSHCDGNPRAPIIKTPLFLITQRRDTVHVGNFFRINHSARWIQSNIAAKPRSLRYWIPRQETGCQAPMPCTLDGIVPSPHPRLSQLLKVVNSLGITISVAAVAIGQDP